MLSSSGNNARVWSYLGFAARLLVGGLFVVAAIGKIQDPAKFVVEMRSYEILPIALANAPAYILPWTELAVGAMLALCLWRREARFLLIVMLVAFTAAKASALFRGLDIICGCGGNFEFLNTIFELPWGILTNFVLLGLLAVDHIAQRGSARSVARISVDTGTAAVAGSD